MSKLASHIGVRVIAQAIVIWAICLLLAMMLLDGRVVLGYYLVASFLYWGGSLIYFRSRHYLRPSDLWAFRLGPPVLFILGLVGKTLLEIFGFRLLH